LSNSKPEKKLRILVVDDEDDILQVIKKGLELEGFDVTTYNSPETALSEYRPGEYDLVLADIRMPRLSGFELYREIKKVDKKAKVCFITAFEIYYDEFRRVFPKLHVNCFIRKPITMKELAKAVREELARQEVEIEQQPPRDHYARGQSKR
jgi:DNA-binding response OmpR family regulator